MNYSNLPENFWDIIEKHLPNYYTRNDVLENDILARYTGEDYIGISDADKAWVITTFGGLKESTIKAFEDSCIKLYLEALETKQCTIFDSPRPENTLLDKDSLAIIEKYEKGVINDNNFNK